MGFEFILGYIDRISEALRAKVVLEWDEDEEEEEEEVLKIASSSSTSVGARGWVGGSRVPLYYKLNSVDMKRFHPPTRLLKRKHVAK